LSTPSEGRGGGEEPLFVSLLQKPCPYKVSPIGFSQEIISRHAQAMQVKAPWYTAFLVVVEANPPLPCALRLTCFLLSFDK